MILERRFVGSTSVRAVDPIHFSSSPGTLSGYSATYNRLSSNLGGFVERIANTAFDRSLRNGDDVVCNFNHDNNLILGRTRSGSLRLRSDVVGLHNECDLPDTSYARDLLASVRRGDVTDQSFAFSVDDEDWSDEPDPNDRGARIKVRTLKSVRLVDTAFVVSAAYPGTSVSAVDSSGGDAVGRSYSFDQLFPDGLPREIRSHVGADVRQLLERARERRRRLVNSVLSI